MHENKVKEKSHSSILCVGEIYKNELTSYAPTSIDHYNTSQTLMAILLDIIVIISKCDDG